MTTYNFSTLNNPKHLVSLGRTAGKILTQSARNEIWQRIHDNFRREAGISSSYYSLVPVPQNRTRFGDIDMIVAKEALPSMWKARLSAKVFGGAEGHQIPGTNTVVFEYRNVQVNVHIVENLNDMRRASLYLGNHGLMGLIRIIGESLGIEYDMNHFRLRTGIESTPYLDIPYGQYSELRVLGISVDFVIYHIYETTDIFKAVYTSQFFNRQVFLDLESQPDYAERVRVNPQIKAFIDYLKANPRIQGETKFDHTSARSRTDFTTVFRSYAPSQFQRYGNLVQEAQLIKLTQGKFNVEKMAAVTGLEGDRLKLVMDLFAQEGFKNEKEFNQFIITSLPETINARILAIRDRRFPNGVDIVAEQAKAAAKAKRGPVSEKVAKKVAVDELKAKLKKAKPTTAKKVTKAKTVKAVDVEVGGLPTIPQASSNSFALAA